MARRRLLGLLAALTLLVAPVGASALAHAQAGQGNATERVAPPVLHPHGVALAVTRVGHERRTSLRSPHAVATLPGLTGFGVVSAWTGHDLGAVDAIDVDPTSTRSRAPPALV